MITALNPAISNNKNQKQNFCAISPKHYAKAQEAVQNKLTYHIAVRDIKESYGLGNLSKTDANDTLDAVKQIYPEKFHHIVDKAKEWISTFAKG